MQISTSPLTHFERIGGADKVRALVQRFYQLMDELPEAYGIRKLHAEDLQGATDKPVSYTHLTLPTNREV